MATAFIFSVWTERDSVKNVLTVLYICVFAILAHKTEDNLRNSPLHYANNFCLKFLELHVLDKSIYSILFQLLREHRTKTHLNSRTWTCFVHGNTSGRNQGVFENCETLFHIR